MESLLLQTSSGPFNSLKESLKESGAEMIENLKEWILVMLNNLQEGANSFLQEMLDFVLYTPELAHDPVILKLWGIVRILSFSLVGVMFVWEGFKKGLSTDIIRAVEFKQMFTRMIYGLILAVFSLDLIDILVHLNDAFISGISSNFPIVIQKNVDYSGFFSSIMVIALLIVQVVIGVKLILQYWMRMAELWFMAVIGPLMYTLWINPNWSGYLSQWFRRLTSTIFTTLAWSILIAIYSSMVSLVASAGVVAGFPTLGPIAGMCLSIALLLVMIETPTFLRGFIDSQQSALHLAKSTISKAVSSTKLGKSMIVKGTGWLKPKTS